MRFATQHSTMAEVRSLLTTSRLSELTLPDGLAFLLTVGVFTFIGGPLGALAGVAICLTRLVTTSLVTFSVSHLVVLGLISSPSSATLALVEIALVPFLCSALWTGSTRYQTIGLCLVWIALLMFVLAGLYSWLDATWLIAGVFAGTILLVTYSIHRYERVLLGLVEEADEVTTQ